MLVYLFVLLIRVDLGSKMVENTGYIFRNFMEMFNWKFILRIFGIKKKTKAVNTLK